MCRHLQETESGIQERIRDVNNGVARVLSLPVQPVNLLLPWLAFFPSLLSLLTFCYPGIGYPCCKQSCARASRSEQTCTHIPHTEAQPRPRGTRSIYSAHIDHAAQRTDATPACLCAHCTKRSGAAQRGKLPRQRDSFQDVTERARGVGACVRR